MGLIEIIIIITLVITFSNILAKILPAIPIFMIQIILGILLGMTKIGNAINFEPEVFLILIIAPLLFREGEKADIPSILKRFGLILFLAFGGVLLTIAGIGFTLHTLMPTIPLAACLAFGAALGPTDAVAVSSLAKRLNIPKGVLHILEGEGLLNDATGVTAFQFAVGALLTGHFSTIEASATLLTASVGGVFAGFVIVWIKRQVILWIEQISAQDISIYLMINLLLPFLAYFLAEFFHASGIIAAVSAGVLEAAGFRKITLFDAELSNVTETTWGTIRFMLNALVFIFLGIELSQVFSPIWSSRLYSNWHLLFIVFLLAVLLFVFRFLFVSGFFLFRYGRKKSRVLLRKRLLLTFGGVKGTVSIATIFILPVTINGLEFKDRSLLLFVTACVTFVTLLVGMIVLPILSDGEVVPTTNPELMGIFSEVITNLQEDMNQREMTEKERFALQAVVTHYQHRIQVVFNDSMPESAQQEFQEIQALILSIERDGLDESFRKRQIDATAYRLYAKFIVDFQESITRKILSFIGFWLIFVQRFLRVILHPKMFWERRQIRQEIIDNYDLSELRRIFQRNSRVILESLENLRDIYDEELIDFFIDERKNLIEQVEGKSLFSAFFIQQDEVYTKELLRGYYLERKVIDKYEGDERITTFAANDYRHRVNLLESYAMKRSSEKGFRFRFKNKQDKK